MFKEIANNITYSSELFVKLSKIANLRVPLKRVNNRSLFFIIKFYKEMIGMAESVKIRRSSNGTVNKKIKKVKTKNIKQNKTKKVSPEGFKRMSSILIWR